MVISLESLVQSRSRELQVILQCADDAHRVALARHPKLASAFVGPSERTDWLDFALKELGDRGDFVRITKENERRNWIELHDGESWHKFAPYFAQLESNDAYTIHAKGREKDVVQPLQFVLPTLVDHSSSTDQGELYGYALRVFRQEDNEELPEIHFVFGTKPSRMDLHNDVIRWAQRAIVSKKEKPQSLVEAYEVEFKPELA